MRQATVAPPRSGKLLDPLLALAMQRVGKRPAA
jgi:hypothetical protein